MKILKSYLENRRQMVLDCADSQIESSEDSILEGFFQGTILGPLLFVVYIDDLPDILKDLDHEIGMEDDVDAYLYAHNDIKSKFGKCIMIMIMSAECFTKWKNGVLITT